MNHPRARDLALAAGLFIAALPAPAYAVEKRDFAVRYLEPNDASALLQVRVPEAHDCAIKTSHAENPATAGQRGVILVACEHDGIIAKLEQALATIDVPSTTRRFHVTVLSASRKDGSTPELPPSEAKALADAKKVMTYRSFQVESEAMLQTDRDLQAVVGGMYNLNISLAPSNRGDSSVDVRSFRLIGQHAGSNAAKPEVTSFDTSFSIREGETIVLGTSEAGDSARMVLVTLLP